jgi:hypothetical protein
MPVICVVRPAGAARSRRGKRRGRTGQDGEAVARAWRRAEARLRQPYLVLCEIDEEQQRVVVLRIDHRADIYRP